MQRIFSIILTVVFVSGGLLFSQTDSTLTVDEVVICKNVQDRQPVGADTSFTVPVENLYCYSVISGATDTTKVTHVWYFGDEEKARVDLAVKAKKWRTWSSKKIMDNWTGHWRVEVLGPNGNLLARKDFVVKAAQM